MSTKQIRDYLAKQVFVERNIVTYRSLSRHFSIHVNQAKNELAQFHQETQFQADKTAATFQLCGILSKRSRSNYASQSTSDDFDMDVEPSQEQDEDGYDDPKGEEVVEITVMLVNARDLEESKLGFDELHSEHVYSLSPAPINDADLICTPIPAIREADRLGGTKLASTVGRIVGADIKMKPGGQPIAGPSKLKPADSKPPLKTAASTPNLGGAQPSKDTVTTSTKNAASSSDKGKEKQKVIAKGDFFKSAPKKAEPLKKAATLKNEPTTTDKNTKPGSMFFGKSTKTVQVKAESPAPPALSKSNSVAAAPSMKTVSPALSAKSTSPEYDGPRGVKRKSSMGLDSGMGKTPATDKVAVKKRVIVSDDEDEAPKVSRRNARRQEVISRMEDEEQRAALALMDVDDDMVERVTRGPPSTVASALPSEDEDGAKGGVSSPGSQPDEDVQMADRQEEEEEEEEDVVVKPKRAPRKPKKEIPVGRNGLKKKRVEKTRRVKDASGNIRIEDYSDWESVDEEEAPPEPKAKRKAAAKPAAKPVKKEPEEESVKVPAPTEKKATTAAPKAKPKPKATGTGTKGKSQASMMQFFGKK